MFLPLLETVILEIVRLRYLQALILNQNFGGSTYTLIHGALILFRDWDVDEVDVFDYV